ncbi:hypothetical protein HHK36_023710 [Tetracentron sinense]|uniref:Uncharacterized protein n=1 Tax=Tetracentron sinense TaxID=13715 RepID=A0A834YQQ7_TETSI|nr:hypothetical protein HHK36_023710 [Tetracentron sinense]
MRACTSATVTPQNEEVEEAKENMRNPDHTKGYFDVEVGNTENIEVVNIEEEIDVVGYPDLPFKVIRCCSIILQSISNCEGGISKGGVSGWGWLLEAMLRIPGWGKKAKRQKGNQPGEFSAKGRLRSMSSSLRKLCFNPDCKDAKSEPFRKGWRLRTGELAELCDRCGCCVKLCESSSAYEEGRFCGTFHSDAAGWRSCESCANRVHCGCIVSVHSFVLLDTGGVECMACARKNIIMAPNPIWPSPLFLPVTLPERLKDHSVKNWNQIHGPGVVAGQWRQAPNLWNNTNGQSELHLRMPYEVERSNGIDKLIPGERPPSASALEKKKIKDLSERVMSGSLKLAAPDILANGKACIEMVTALKTFHWEEGNLNVLQLSCCLAGENDPMDKRKVAIAEPSVNNSVAAINYEARPKSCVNISLQSSISKDDPSTPDLGLGVPYAVPSETNGQTRVSGSQSQQKTPPAPLAKQFYANPHNGVDSTGETQMRNGRPRGDARGRNQLLPRYWPRITDQELQQISGDSNSVITPLFEKMLSASDAGRIGRLVLPKKCAEVSPYTSLAYFPPISQPEGLPLQVQDARGKEWVFQFRFWPNNNSRMYVLEGVTPCIQSMQLQAGDIVTFSRIDPEEKLVMGFRKASTIPPSDQDNQTLKIGCGVSTNGEVNNTKTTSSEVVSIPLRNLKVSSVSTSFSSINQVNSADPASTWSKGDKSGLIPKEVPGAKSSLPSKRKSSILGSKSKRLRIEKEDLIEIKLSWEEAQGLLRPPPNHVPSIVLIDDHEFEEYEEAPILGKPTIFTTNHVGEKIQWVQCEDCSKWRKLPADALLPSRWTCSDNSRDPKSLDGPAFSKSLCSSTQEIAAEQLEKLLSSNNAAASKKPKAAKRDTDIVEASEGLDTLANLAVLEEGVALSPSTQPTTKHPRHRPGCSCIVCIQPPSGKGPKHKQTCTCNVCLTVKRRFRTLMLRREKRQSEKEAESSSKKQQQQLQLPLKLEQEDDPLISSLSQNIVVNEGADEDPNRKKSSLSPFKGRIDLNIQPEREEELSPVSDSGNMLRLLEDAAERYLRQQRLLISSGNRDPTIDQIEPGRVGGGREKLVSGVSIGNGHLDADVDHPVTLNMSASKPANS